MKTKKPKKKKCNQKIKKIKANKEITIPYQNNALIHGKCCVHYKYEGQKLQWTT